MSSTDSAARVAVCTNTAECAIAGAGNVVEWYQGAGEYCPECGEVLTPSDGAAPDAPAAPKSAPETPVAQLRTAVPDKPPPAAQFRPPKSAPRRPRLLPALRWFWIVATVIVAGGALLYFTRRDVAVQGSAGALAVCPIPGARQFAVDFVNAYAAKTGTPPSRFVVTSADAATCDIRFSTAPETPQAVIARDGIVAIVNPLNSISRISETQLRQIFSGSIRDWSQLGGPREAIVALLPDAGSQEAKALESSLFYGVAVDRGVRRRPSSTDVTNAVTGADRTGRASIGLVFFSAAVAAKVLPLTYLPAPSVLTIASHRYPFTLAIALQAASQRDPSAVARLIEFARSRDGVAIVQKNGLVVPEGI